MFNLGQDHITDLLFKCLMVAGGYAVGYVLAMFAGIGFDKVVTHRKSPDELHKVVRIIGGLLFAILVAVLVFRQGGGGGGDGDGPGTKPGQTTGTGTAGGTDSGTKPTEPERTNTRVTVEAVRVTVLAGDEVERGTLKFYRLAGQAERVDRGAVMAAVTDRKKAAKGAVVLVYEFGQEAGVKTIGFTDLESDAKQLGVQLMSAAEFEQFGKR